MSTQQDLFTAAVADAVVNDAVGKKWYESKTFWTNTVAFVALGLQMKYGFIIDANYQALGLTLINLILRKVTKDPIVW